ncbi:MAG: RNA-binding protein, partial [Ruminococcaceae bacterium]|nr:RNA-binding protein [Oscillospiraceae bacterium]
MNFELSNEEERFLFAHISDLAELSQRTGVPRFSRFLNEREAIVAGHSAAQTGAVPIFYGGYDGAARTVCGFLRGTYAEDMPADELFPVRAVTFSFRGSDKLSHRDFLGAVLSVGLQRNVVGDILVAEDHAV